MDGKGKLINCFLNQLPNWICDGYFIDCRYMAILSENNQWDIVSASINFNPLPLNEYSRLHIDTDIFIAGHLNAPIENYIECHNILKNLLNGFLELHDVSARMSNGCYLYENKNDEFFQPLKIRVVGNQALALENINDVNKILSNLDIPFDGLPDLARWLLLPLPGSSVAPSIDIRINPPVDIGLCSLTSDRLQISLEAHKNFDVKVLKLALITIPDSTLNGRIQVADSIKWDHKDGLKKGFLDLILQGAQNVLAILLVGDQVVRRQWVIDADRAKNHRYLTMNHYDKELKMLRRFLFEDSSKFEAGIATLFYMLGFASGLCLETDAPDIVLSSPSGKLIVVEVTTRFKG